MNSPPSMNSPSPPRPRSTYRHGDLHRALLDAGVELARQGGPDAVVLREATRRAGVVPNAAYRHFESREALLGAVRAEALVAVARAMEAELDTVDPGLDAPALARAGVRAVGTGYLRFAQAETGLFRTAFSRRAETAGANAETGADGGAALERIAVAGCADDADAGPHPFALLGAALDRLVEAGVMPAPRRPGAEYLAWSAVHGMALLVIEGPLRGRPQPEIDALGQRLLDMVEQGL
ncbi:TetR/AcrR family transcriptional regulator [Variovorax sp. J22P168]|uniref:TetR/AcrR family transcriptional regulator n=1 Tax=Variovorax jilinensis TaxID=3053513 RepID=UPI002575785E|nr:TetR/AcrR family transcriptional regulator [Variovorax sp. J22P168]MDM0014180.1 TetR/AcrR family transcriptional regulator [Variovorax sp. J22P168]